MNANIVARQRKGIAIALKQFPWLRTYDKQSGIYLWYRHDYENGTYCWYIGKAKNLLHRTAQHIMDSQSHLDKSIKKHGITTKPFGDGWNLSVLEVCEVEDLDELEQYYIKDRQKRVPNGKMYNIESGGTTGKTIIGEKKQRRDVKWKAEARAKVLAEYREYFDLEPKDNAYKKNGYNELKAEPKKLKDEFYNDKK